LNERDYRALHTELLRACRSVAESAEGEKRELFENLEVLARPWLSRRALEQADREVLLDLALRCQWARRQIGGRDRGAKGTVRLAVAVIVFVCLVAWLALTRVRGWAAARQLTAECARLFQQVIGHPGEAAVWVGASAVVALTAILAIGRALRS
jgi:hypothetical protein